MERLSSRGAFATRAASRLAGLMDRAKKRASDRSRTTELLAALRLGRGHMRRSLQEALRGAIQSGELAATLDYADHRGSLALRQAVSGYLARVRGVRIDPARILIVQGFTQGLDLLCRVLRKRGARTVAMESPSLPPAWSTIRGAGLRLVGRGVDEDGLVVNALSSLHADATVVTPAHQFPTGAVMAPDRRVALVEWAARNDAFVIEDDYDAEFRF